MEDLHKHLFTAFIVRVVLSIYSVFHDNMFTVPYTDVDYRVFTDAARHVWEGRSPYNRFTYRYPPILAWLLIPNLWFPIWGKLFFSVCDIIVGWLVYKIVLRQGCTVAKAKYCAATWLYNPVALLISTRGNSDSLTAALVLSSLFFVIEGKVRPILGGMLLGFAIHIRLYPVAFSLPMYLALGPRPVGKRVKWRTKAIAAVWPDISRLFLTVSCGTTLLVLTVVGWRLYGWQCIQESILYHLNRRDMRHNFSPYFYMLYLGAGQTFPFWQRALTFLPQIVLLFSLAITFGTRRNTLPFCLLTEAVVMVIYNPVITAQYFVWFLSLLPPVIPFLHCTVLEVTKNILYWAGAMGMWLIQAYLLEFQGVNSFYHIFLHSIAFFVAHIAGLVRLVKGYRSPDPRRFKWE